ncbi:RNA polymerase sigma factor [Cohnella sp. 56]|uniref:RNA polymerase sigma factor n=1 Tax=Cohnella sp. 56 TaxID=3113722 RepID=UPI0030E8C8DA
MENIEDHDLIYRTRLGPDEMDALVKQHWQDVWQYALFLTRREHVAEDIAQETFMKAMGAVASYRGDGPVKHWLFRIARNTAFNYRKSAFWRKVVLVGLFPDGSRSSSAESEYWRGELSNEVWSAVWELPAKYREPIMLFAYYEWSYREMAELLGISEGTVKSRLHRARAMLADRMKEAKLDGWPDNG